MKINEKFIPTSEADFRIGATVMVTVGRFSGNQIYEGIIVGETKTLWKVEAGGQKYRFTISTGNTPGDTWCQHSSMKVYNQKEIDRGKLQRLESRLRHNISTFNLKLLSTEQLKSIISILKEVK